MRVLSYQNGEIVNNSLFFVCLFDNENNY